MRSKRVYYLYILQCADGTFYTGITTDLDRRLREHNTSPRASKYTRSRRPVALVYSKKFRDRSAASKAEAKMKKLSREEKMSMIAK
ncbi:MAG: GIY-YIG nuclease family protein [Patescibacteria group bacterium]